MSKKLFVLIAIIAVLLVGVSVVAAQGNGNGGNGNRGSNGNGNNGNGNAGMGYQQVCDPEQPEDCLNTPQMNAYGGGGIGFVNPQTGAQWNGQQRGQMGRGSGMNGTGLYTSLPPAYEGELPQEVIDLMIDGWVDEQHAYAVYESVIAQFGEVSPFVSIQMAEAQHSAAWELLFDRYGIVTPAVPEFDVPLFDTVSDACLAAAGAEVANFGLYDTMLETFAAYPDIYQIALSLRNASEYSHLPAFQSCAN